MKSKLDFIFDVERIVVLLFVLNSFFYPISAIISSFLPYDNSIVNITYRFIILFLAVYIILLQLILRNISLRIFSIPLFLFLLFYLFRIFWDTFIEGIKIENSLFQLYSFYIGGVLIPALAISIAHKSVDYVRILKYSFWVLFISNLLMLLVYVYQKKWEVDLGFLLSRAQIIGSNEDSLLLNPISYGIYSGYLLVVSIFMLFYFKIETFKIRILLRLALFLSLINLLLSTSRGPFVFTLLSFLFLFCIYFIKNIRSNIFYLRFIFISLFIFVSFFYTSTKLNSEGIEFGIFQRLINTKESFEKGYVEARNELYDEGIIMFLEAPFFGKSIVLESTSSYPHNSFIEILMATGLFGMFLYLLIILLLIFNFLYHFKKSKLIFLFFGFFILSFGISLTSGNLYQSVDNWGLITLLLSFNTYKNNHECSLNDFNNS